jgi:predicted acyl esterase
MRYSVAVALLACAAAAQTEKHLMVPMRDGTRLSVYLYFPEGKGPWPVLYVWFSQTM